MAMNGKDLGDRIAEILTDSKAPADMKAQIKAIWEKIGSEIVAEVKKAQITVAAGIPVSTTGSPTAQTGATTSTGSGTVTA